MLKRTIVSTRHNVKVNALPLDAKQAKRGGTKWNLLLLLLVLFIGFIAVVNSLICGRNGNVLFHYLACLTL